MNKRELLKKVKANEGLTVEEIIEYLKEHNVGKYWSLAGSLPEYLHNVDKQADRLYMTMYNKLSKSERFKKTGDFMKDLQMETEKQKLIEEEILTELVYVD